MGGGKDHEQKKDVRKREIFGTMERMHGGRRHMGKQGKLEECNGISRRIQKEIPQQGRRRIEAARGGRR